MYRCEGLAGKVKRDLGYAVVSTPPITLQEKASKLRAFHDCYEIFIVLLLTVLLFSR